MSNFPVIPLYYHVPKCGGTYFYNMCYSMHTKIYNHEPILIHVRDEKDNIAFRFMVSNGIKYKKIKFWKKHPSHKNVYETTISNISQIFNNIEHSDIHIIVVCSSGFKISSLIISEIDALDIVVKPYITIRNTFERISSLYCYLTSKNSIHEKTHKFKQIDFENFILTEKDWITTNIMGLDRAPTYEDCATVIQILDNFIVRDLSLIDSVIKNIYNSVYGQDSQKILELIADLSDDIDKNSTDKPNNINFKQLSHDIKLQFLHINTLDRLIYDYFTQT